MGRIAMLAGLLLAGLALAGCPKPMDEARGTSLARLGQEHQQPADDGVANVPVEDGAEITLDTDRDGNGEATPGGGGNPPSLLDEQGYGDGQRPGSVEDVLRNADRLQDDLDSAVETIDDGMADSGQDAAASRDSGADNGAEDTQDVDGSSVGHNSGAEAIPSQPGRSPRPRQDEPPVEGQAPGPPPGKQVDSADSGLISGPPGYQPQRNGMRPPADASLAGEWRVVALTSGDATEYFAQGEYEMMLDATGTAEIVRDETGERWQKTGSWDYDGMLLSFKLGPGGVEEYRISGEDRDIKVLTSLDGSRALFALRVRGDAVVPRLENKYRTDFGPLEIAPSGQGWWRGSYGDPEGKIVVRQDGPFMVGTWEQQPSAGGVVLRLTHTGFTGYWWYNGSTGLDGRWNGSKR